jgi:hypothetical protein
MDAVGEAHPPVEVDARENRRQREGDALERVVMVVQNNNEPWYVTVVSRLALSARRSSSFDAHGGTVAARSGSFSSLAVR